MHGRQDRLAGKQEQQQNTQGDQQLAQQHDALAPRRQLVQQTQEHRHIAERVENQKQQDGRRQGCHGVLTATDLR